MTFSRRLRLLDESNACLAHAALPLVMGVCNVTPDSFSDGGEAFGHEAAFARVDQLLAEGADVIDIGGESTRPGAPSVPAAEQLVRVLEVVRYAAARALVSIDTTDAEVARACLAAGARVVNDVSCLQDPALATVTREADACLVLMHARGPQSAMLGPGQPAQVQDDEDIVRAVLEEWRAAAARAEARGLARERLVFDPGLGFGKTTEESMTLLCELRRLRAQLDVPMLVGASRKSFLTTIDPAPPKDRLGASVAAAVLAWQAGASCVRVHDVRATKQALALTKHVHTTHTTVRERGAAHA